MTRGQRHGLVGAIFSDLFRNAKIRLTLLALILISATFVVTTVYRTRLLTSECEQLLLESHTLDIEWRNLILEENALSDHGRVERIATEIFQMQHVDLLQENIIVKQ